MLHTFYRWESKYSQKDLVTWQCQTANKCLSQTWNTKTFVPSIIPFYHIHSRKAPIWSFTHNLFFLLVGTVLRFHWPGSRSTGRKLKIENVRINIVSARSFFPIAGKWEKNYKKQTKFTNSSKNTHMYRIYISITSEGIIIMLDRI